MSYLRKATTSWRWLLTGLSLAVLLLLLAMACKEEEEAGPAAPGTPAAETPAAETPAAETPVAETPTPSAEEGAAELQALAGAAEAITAKVTYRFSSTADGQTTEGTWTLTQRPPDIRMDFTSTEGTFAFIQAGGKSYFCTEAEGQGQCFSVPAEQAEQQTALFQPILETTASVAEGEIEAFNLVETSERTIAGVEGKCYKVEAAALLRFGEWEGCFSEEGILLLVRGTSPEGEFSIEATDVSTDVTDVDFEPPFPVTELPEGYG